MLEVSLPSDGLLGGFCSFIIPMLSAFVKAQLDLFSKFFCHYSFAVWSLVLPVASVSCCSFFHASIIPFRDSLSRLSI